MDDDSAPARDFRSRRREQFKSGIDLQEERQKRYEEGIISLRKRDKSDRLDQKRQALQSGAVEERTLTPGGAASSWAASSPISVPPAFSVPIPPGRPSAAEAEGATAASLGMSFAVPPPMVSETHEADPSERRMQELFAENLGISSSPSSSPLQPSSRILNLNSSPSMEIFPASVIAAANAGSNSSASGDSNGEQDLSGSAEQADDNMSAEDGISELRPLPAPGARASQCVCWCKVASIPELAHALQVAATGSLLVEPRLLAAVAIETRQRLARDRDIPIRECVDAGMVPALVRLMVETDDQELRFELSWSLTNIASGEGEGETAAVVENGGLQAFLQVLRSDRALDARVCDQCVWAIGNVAGDGPRYRDLLLEHGAVPLLRDLYFTIPNLADWTAAKKRDCARDLMWTLGNLCRGTPKPVLGKVAAAFEVFCDAVFADGDEELVYEALWGLNYLVAPGKGSGEVAGGGSSSSAASPGLVLSRPSPEAASTSTTTGGDHMGADPQKETGRLYDAGQAREARAAIELFFERGQVNPYEAARMEQGEEKTAPEETNRTGSAMVDVLLGHFFHSMRNRWVVTKILAAIVSCPGEAQGYNRYPYQRRHASASAAASTSGEAPLVSGTFTRLVLQTKQLFPAMLAFLKFPEGRRLEELMQNLKKQARLQSGSQRGAAAGRGGGSQVNHELLAVAAIAEYKKLPGLASLFVDHAMGRTSATPRNTRRRSKNSQEPHPSTLTHIEDGFAFNMGAQGYTSEKKLAQHKRECAAFLCSVAGTRFVSEFWTASLSDPNANPGMQIVTGPLRKSPKGVDSVIAVPDAEVHPDICLFQEEIRKNRSRSSWFTATSLAAPCLLESSKQGAASDVAVNLHNHGAPRASGRVVDAVEGILADDSTAEMNEINMDRGRGAAPAVRTVTPAPGITTSNSVSRSISREQDGIDHAAHGETHTQPASTYDGVCVLRDVINGTLTASDAAQRECALALSHVLEAADLGQVHALVVEYGVVGAYCDLLQSPAATMDPLLIAFCVKTLETCFHLSVLHPALVEQAGGNLGVGSSTLMWSSRVDAWRKFEESGCPRIAELIAFGQLSNVYHGGRGFGRMGGGDEREGKSKSRSKLSSSGTSSKNKALNIAAERAARFASAIESWEAELREAYDRMSDTIINDTSFFANKTISTTPLKSLAHTRPSGFDSWYNSSGDGAAAPTDVCIPVVDGGTGGGSGKDGIAGFERRSSAQAQAEPNAKLNGAGLPMGAMRASSAVAAEGSCTTTTNFYDRVVGGSMRSRSKNLYLDSLSSDEDHLQLQKDKGGAVDMVVPSTFGAAAQSAFHFGHQQQPMVDRTSGVLLDEDNVNMND